MEEIKILALDPGNSTGWCLGDSTHAYKGGTCKQNHLEVADLILHTCPDILVIERFNLYPQMAKSLAWNSFYPCEVIGVIRYLSIRDRIRMFEQAPSIKKYAGGFKEDWDALKRACAPVTEHTKDAYLHYKYFIRNTYNKRPST